MALLEPCQSAINCSGKERGKRRLRHDDTTENERAGKREIDQSGSESSPEIGQPFSDQKCECYRCHNRKRNRNARGRGISPKNLIAGYDQPVEQRRFLQTWNAVIGRQQILVTLNHFARGGGILAFGLTVKIADSNRPKVQQDGECNQNSEEGVPGWRRGQCLWSKKRFLNAKRPSARDHFSERPPPRRDIGPNYRASVAILPTAFGSTPASGGIRRSGHRPCPGLSEKRTKIAPVRGDRASLQSSGARQVLRLGGSRSLSGRRRDIFALRPCPIRRARAAQPGAYGRSQ